MTHANVDGQDVDLELVDDHTLRVGGSGAPGLHDSLEEICSQHANLTPVLNGEFTVDLEELAMDAAGSDDFARWSTAISTISKTVRYGGR